MVTAVTVTLVTLVTVLFIVTRNNLLGSYAKLERLELKEDILRVENAIRASGQALDTLTHDWASWNDSYEFVQTRSQAYIDSNLGKETFAGADLRMIIYTDSDGHVAYGRTVSPQTGEPGDIPPAMRNLLDDERLLQKTPEESARGIAVVGDDVLLVAARPLLTSESTGPVRGTLIMARDFDSSVLAEVTRTTSMDVTVERLDSPALPEDFTSARATLTSTPSGEDPGVAFETLGRDLIAGYKLLDDVFGEPSHVLRVQVPRTIFAHAEHSLTYFLVSLVVVGVVLLLLVVYLLDRLVLLPLSRLNRHVTHVAESGDLSLLYRPPGSGELAQLADNIRVMLDEVSRARTDLEQVNEQLEKRVQERTAELVLARDEAVDALRVKDHILANVSHDSRTPLNTIILRAELMKAGRYGALSDAQGEALDSIVASVNQLTLFTTNLLYEGQSAAGRIDLRGEAFELEPELQRIVDMMRPLAERRGLALDLECPADDPVPVVLNRQALHQVVANLVDNAIKFTDRGAVRIHVELPDESRVAISVADTGKGIPENLHRQIFDPFWQVDSSVTRAANRGVGLGLSIVRLLVGRLGGEVAVDNVEDGGTVFTVTLPRHVE